MELKKEINDGIGITPEQTPIILTLARSPIHKDVVSSEERAMLNGKGHFKQYTIYGRDENGVLRSVRFLMGNDLLSLTSAFPDKSEEWEGLKVSVTFQPEKGKDGKMYNRARIVPLEMTVAA